MGGKRRRRTRGVFLIAATHRRRLKVRKGLGKIFWESDWLELVQVRGLLQEAARGGGMPFH